MSVMPLSVDSDGEETLRRSEKETSGFPLGVGIVPLDLLAEPTGAAHPLDSRRLQFVGIVQVTGDWDANNTSITFDEAFPADAGHDFVADVAK